MITKTQEISDYYNKYFPQIIKFKTSNENNILELLKKYKTSELNVEDFLNLDNRFVYIQHDFGYTPRVGYLSERLILYNINGIYGKTDIHKVFPILKNLRKIFELNTNSENYKFFKMLNPELFINYRIFNTTVVAYKNEEIAISIKRSYDDPVESDLNIFQKKSRTYTFIKMLAINEIIKMSEIPIHKIKLIHEILDVTSI